MDSSPVTLQPVGDGYNVMLEGKALYSRYYPRHGAQRGLPVAKTKVLYVVASPLLGYGLDVFLQRLPSDSYILAVEYDPRLIILTQEYSPQWSHDRVSLLMSPDDQTLDSFLKKLDTLQFESCELLILNQGYMLQKDHYDHCLQFCRQYLYLQQQNHVTLRKNADLWLMHLIQNLSFLPTSHPYHIQPSQDALVIAGAGASLENTIDSLKKYRQNFRLVAVDTALPCLLAHDIYPDLMIVVESSYHNIQDFLAFPQANPIVMADMTSLPQQKRIFGVNLAYFITHFAPVLLLSRLCNATALLDLPPLGSVGITALGFALKITRGPIFFTGLDFSFSLGKNHASGAYSHQQMLLDWHRLAPNKNIIQQFNRPLIPQKNAREEIIYTDPVLLGYAYMAAQGDKTKIFTLTQEGLPLGYQQGSLAQLPSQKHLWTFLHKPREKCPDLSIFIQGEIALLDQFLQQKYEVLEDLNYLFLGYGQPSRKTLQQYPQIQDRAYRLYQAWQYSLSSLHAEQRGKF